MTVHSNIDRYPLLPTEFNEQYRYKLQQIIREHAAAIWDAAYGARWEDLRFPVQTVRLLGAGQEPGLNTTDGLLDFDKARTETVVGVAQMPHSWAHEAYPVIKPHIHLQYRAGTSGDSVWQFEYDVANVNGTFAGSYTALTAVTHTGPASATTHSILALGDVNLTGYRASCILKWKLSRLGGATADTFDNDIGLLEFDIHYQNDTKGTIQEYTD